MEQQINDQFVGQPSPQLPKSKSTKLFWFIVAIVLAVIIVGGGLYAWQSGVGGGLTDNLRDQIIDKKSVDEIKEGILYKNNKYGFEFRRLKGPYGGYRFGCGEYINPPSRSHLETYSFSVFCDNYIDAQDKDPRGVSFSVSVRENNERNYTTVEEYAQATKKDIENSQGVNDIKIEPVVVNGKNGVSLSYYYEQKYMPGKQHTTFVSKSFFERQNDIIVVGYSYQKEVDSDALLMKSVIQKMFSTFKFTEPNPEVDCPYALYVCNKVGEENSRDSICWPKSLKIIIEPNYFLLKNNDGSISYDCLPDTSRTKNAAYICADCGNRVCGIGENQCNCPEDCTSYTINKYSEGWSIFNGKDYHFSINFPATWGIYDFTGIPNLQIPSFGITFIPNNGPGGEISVTRALVMAKDATTSLTDIVKRFGATKVEQGYIVAGMEAVKTDALPYLAFSEEAYCFFDGNKDALYCISYASHYGSQEKDIFQNMVDSFKLTAPSQ